MLIIEYIWQNHSFGFRLTFNWKKDGGSNLFLKSKGSDKNTTLQSIDSRLT